MHFAFYDKNMTSLCTPAHVPTRYICNFIVPTTHLFVACNKEEVTWLSVRCQRDDSFAKAVDNTGGPLKPPPKSTGTVVAYTPTLLGFLGKRRAQRGRRTVIRCVIL